MSYLRPRISYLGFTLLLSLYFCLVVNFPLLRRFYQILSELPAYKLGFAISIPLLLFVTMNVLFTLVSFKPLLKPVAIILLLLSAPASYAAWAFHIIFDRGMIENILETQQSEAYSYWNGQLLIWLLLTGVLPALLVWRTQITYPATALKRLGVRGISLLLSFIFIAGVAGLYYKDYASVGRNNRTLNLEILPTSYLYSGYQVFNKKYLSPAVPFQQMGLDAKLQQPAGQKPTLLFLIVGETARAQNQSALGYSQETNAFTQKQAGVVNFKQVSSCGTATAISVPCMFSNMTRHGFDNERVHRMDSVLDILQRAGVSLFWQDNDEGCKGVCDRVPNKIIDTSPHNNDCDGSTCYDQVLLPGIDAEIDPNGSKNALIALHLNGSHGPTYYQRYPAAFRVFTPDCPRSDIENCTQQQLVNTYDNSLRYTDYIVSQVIDKARSYQDKYNVAVIYLSDHGESLGENGLYLHGAPYAVAPSQQTHVPMLFWLSEGYSKALGVDNQCLQKNAAEQSYSHDNLFHTLLGAMNVQTRVWQPELDILQSCRRS